MIQQLIPLVGFIGERLLVVLFVLLAAYSVGRRALRRLSFAGILEELSFSTGLGLGLAATAFLSLAALGIFTPVAVILLLSVCLASGYPFLLDVCRRALDRPRSRRALLLIIVAILASVPAFLLASYPPLGFDDLMYHLPLARAYAQTHQAGPQPHLRFWMLPQLNEMLFAAALLLRDDVSAQYVELSLFLLAGLALFTTGRRLQSARAGAWATGLWIGSPLAIRLGTVAYVDMGAACFAALACCAFLIFSSTGDARWLPLAGVLAGFAAASKYNGLALVLILAGGALFLPGCRMKNAALLCGSAGIAAGPWYLRTYLLTGNPVAPFLGRVFGFRYWDARDLEALRFNLHATGLPRTLVSFLSLPWHLIADARRFGIPEGTLTLPLFALLPLVLLAPLGLRHVRLAGIGVFLYLVFWFLTAQDARFLLPALPWMVLAIAGWSDGLLSRVDHSGKIRLWVGAAGLVAGLAPGMGFVARRVDGLGLPPATAVSRQAFLEKRFPELPCYEALNDRYGPHYRAYAFHDPLMTYYAEGTLMGDWFGPARYANIDRRTGMSLHRSLKALGVQFLAVHWSVLAVDLPADQYFHEHFCAVCTAPGMVMYRMTSAPAAASALPR